MARPACAFQDAGDARHVDVSLLLQPLRIDRSRGRREHQIDAAEGQLLAVFLQRARVARQIVRPIELHRIDEDAHHHHVGAGARFIDQRHMAVVQVAHGRHQRDAFAFLAPAADLLTQHRQGFDNNHWVTPGTIA